jgi:uncharacterized membrane protein
MPFSKRPNESVWRRIARGVLASLFVAAGTWHFVRPGFYRSIVPPGFGPPAVMVAISGAAEILGGIGLLVPRLRRAAGWGLVALLVAVFPANVYMLTARDRIPGDTFPAWALWVRLPLQGVLTAGVLWSAGIIGRANRQQGLPPSSAAACAEPSAD